MEKEKINKIADILQEYMRGLEEVTVKFKAETKEFFPKFYALMEQEAQKAQNNELQELVRKIEDMGWEVTLKLKKDAQ